jgi:hypothetical protein
MPSNWHHINARYIRLLLMNNNLLKKKNSRTRKVYKRSNHPNGVRNGSHFENGRLLHEDSFIFCGFFVLYAFAGSKFDYACCRAKMEAILNQSLFHLLCQTSVTGKLTLLSWTSQTQL